MEDKRDRLKQFSDLASEKKADRIFEKLIELEEEIGIMRDQLEEVQQRTAQQSQQLTAATSNGRNGRLTLRTEDGEPTQQAWDWLFQVVKNGVEGVTSRDIADAYDYSQQTGSNKLNALKNTFPDELKIHESTDPTKPNRLLHQDIKKVPKDQLLESLKDLKMMREQPDEDVAQLHCPGCGARISEKGLDRMGECPGCGQDPEEEDFTECPGEEDCEICNGHVSK